MSLYHSHDDPRRPELIGDLFNLAPTPKRNPQEDQATIVLGWLADNSPMIGRAILELFLPGQVPASGEISARTQLSLPKSIGGYIRPDLSICVADHALQLLIEVKIDAPIHTHADYDDAPQPDAYRQAWKQLGQTDLTLQAVGTLTVNAAEHQNPDPENMIARDVTWRELAQRLHVLLDAGEVEAECELVAKSLVRAINTRISPRPLSHAEVEAFLQRWRPLLETVRDALLRRIPGAGPTKAIRGHDYAGSRITLPSATAAPLYVSLSLAPAGSSANLVGGPGALIAWPERDMNGNLAPGEALLMADAGFAKAWTHGGWSYHARAWPLVGSEAVSDPGPISDEIAAMLTAAELIGQPTGEPQPAAEDAPRCR